MDATVRQGTADAPVRVHADLLSGVELFSSLDRITLAKLAAHLTPVACEAGAEVVREGEPADSMYIVAEGSLEVAVATDTAFSDRRVAVLERGAPFGEMALLTSEPRTATVRALEASEVLRLERSHFMALIRQQPEVAVSIAATLSRRLRAAQSSGTRPTPAGGSLTPDGKPKTTDKKQSTPLAARRLTAWVFFGVVLVVGWSFEAPLGLATAGWHALISLLAVVPLLALGLLPEGVLALMLAGIWVVGGVAPLSAALGGFASSSWVLLVSVLAVGTAVASSGVLYRLALWTVAHTSGGFTGQVLALGLTGLILGPAAPNATGRVTLIAPALTELSEALGFESRSKASAGLAMAAFVGFGQMTAPFLTSSTTAVLVFAVLPAEARADFSWMTWAVCGAVLHVVLFVGLMLSVLVLYRPGKSVPEASADASSALALQRALLGRLTREEYLTVAVTVGLLLGFVTQALHGVHPAWVSVAALAILGAARVVTANTLKTVNWSFALLFGVLASMSAVFSEAGVDLWIADLAAGAMGDFADRPAVFLALFTLACMAISFALRWQAAAPLLTIALAPVADAAGIHPIVIGIIAVVACSGFFMPYQSTIYLALYHGTEEKLFSHAQARPLAFAFGVITLLSVIASVPYWRFLGLL